MNYFSALSAIRDVLSGHPDVYLVNEGANALDITRNVIDKKSQPAKRRRQQEVKGGRVLCTVTGKIETIPFASSKSGNDWSLLMVEVTDNTARHRFEMTVDGKEAFLDYAIEDGRLVLVHTEVPQVLAGRGVGTALVRLVLDEARSRGLRIVPQCEFVETYIRHHPEFADLVAASPAQKVLPRTAPESAASDPMNLQISYYCGLDSGPNGHGLSKLRVSESQVLEPMVTLFGVNKQYSYETSSTDFHLPQIRL